MATSLTADGFWGEHDPEEYTSATKFINAVEYEELAARAARIGLCEVVGPVESKFGEKYQVAFTVDGGDDVRKKSFACGEGEPTGRDRLLADAQAYLERNPTATVPVRFVMRGSMHGIEPDLDLAPKPAAPDLVLSASDEPATDERPTFSDDDEGGR